MEQLDSHRAGAGWNCDHSHRTCLLSVVGGIRTFPFRSGSPLDRNPRAYAPDYASARLGKRSRGPAANSVRSRSTGPDLHLQPPDARRYIAVLLVPVQANECGTSELSCRASADELSNDD